MRNRLGLTTAFLGLAGGLCVGIGCAGSPGGDGWEADFRAALPAPETLTIRLPGAKKARRTVEIGEIATLYALTRTTSEDINGHVAGLLGQIPDFAQGPPSAAGPGGIVFGPVTPTLSPVTYRLVVSPAAPGFALHLDGRPKASANDGDFRPLVAGQVAGGPGGAQGQLALDGTAAHALDPVGTPVAQDVVVAWTLAPTQVEIAVGLGRADGAMAQYRYDALADGSGAFRFATAMQLPGAPAIQQALVRSRWLPSGAGRGDAHLETDTPTGAQAADVTECWDDGFARVFYAAPGQIEGLPAACVFADPLPLTPNP